MPSAGLHWAVRPRSRAQGDDPGHQPPWDEVGAPLHVIQDEHTPQGNGKIRGPAIRNT